jgi:Glycosyl transferase family 2
MIRFNFHQCIVNAQSCKPVFSQLHKSRPRTTILHHTSCRKTIFRASAGDGGNGDGGSNGGGGNTNNNRDDNNRHDPWFRAQNVTLLISAGALLTYLCQPNVDFLPTENTPVSIIVPALNEEIGITETIAYLNSLSPAADEIILVDGGSNDNTVKLAKKAGAKVVRSKRGRGRQMNEGAKKVTTESAAAAGKEINKNKENSSSRILMFVHSDSRPPQDAILRARETLSDPRVVLGGFFTSIEHNGKILLFTTFHQFVSTYYAPLLFAPVRFVRGLRCMFGDQSLFCRAEDFWRVGGFDCKLPIMEDADLCGRLHKHGLANGKPGREVQLNNCVNRTSGRRIAPWGNWQTTKIHFNLSLAWWRGASPEKLWELYDTWYTDAFR